MSSRYILKIVTGFSSAHTLRNYPGKCSRMHGHNWKLEVEVEASELDEIGMGIDFKTIKRHANDLAEKLDHQYLNELEYFSEINPTAENIASWFYHQLSGRLNDARIKVTEVTIWETESACVSYRQE